MAKTYAATAPRETAAAPTQTTRRVTRSQSAEPQEATLARGAVVQSTSAEPPPASKAGGGRGGGGGGGRKTKVRNVADPLPTVDEITTPAEDAAIPEDVVADKDADASPGRGSNASVFSGTTVKTSFSQDEISKLDYEVICDVLPDLLTASEKLTQLLVPHGIATSPETWKEIKRTGSKHNKLFSARWDSLHIHKPSLTSVEYIEPSYVLRALLNVQSVAEVQPAVWRPDNVLFKINTSLMLRTVLVQCDPADWTEEATGALERLDMAFPAGIAGGEFNFSALDFWLDLAAHVTIHRLETAIDADPGFSTRREIDNVFLNDDNEFKHTKALGLSAANGEDQNRAMEMVNQLIATLKQPFEQMGATAAIGYLKAKFQWDDFRAHALRYSDVRLAEVNRRIEAAGGIEAIVAGLQEQAERRASEKLAEQMKQDYTKTGTTPRRSLGGKSAIALLKGREKKIVEKAQTPAFTAPVANMVASSGLPQHEDTITHDFAADHQPYINQEDRRAPAEVQSTAQQALARFSATQKQKAKTNRARLVDRQEGAVRISDNMSEDCPSQASAITGKRTHAQMEDDVPADFDPTQDDGFENDTRERATTAKRRAAVAFQRWAPQRSATSEPRSSPAPGPSTISSSAAARPSPAKRQRKNPGSSIPPMRPRPDPEGNAVSSSEFYKFAKQDAKYNRVLSGRGSRPQIRTPWSDAEEHALIDLIIENVDESESISYSSLKAIDSSLDDEAQLSKRTAEDIRFKARNMKLTLLLADRKLPKNWDKVMLDKKAIDKLHSRGIVYEQARVRTTGRSTPMSSVGVSYESGGIL